MAGPTSGAVPAASATVRPGSGAGPDGLDGFTNSAGWSSALGSTRVIFGPGSLAGLGEIGAGLEARKALLVTDKGVRAAGHADRARDALQGVGITTVIFDGVEENPTTRHVEEGARFAQPHAIDLLVGLGGGSAMDCAKGINFLLTNGGRMEDYWGTNLAARPMLPSVGIPTTAGTGSEAQSYALIEQEGSRRKMACGDEKARFRVVLLDPDLTATMPRNVAAAAGVDAISHVVESYVTTRRNPISRMFARSAWRLLSESFADAIHRHEDVHARGHMMVGALLAGASIEASMLGAAHACANPITSRYELAHGAAVLLMLPHVVRFNEPVVGDLYEELVREDAATTRSGDLAARLEAMRRDGGLPERLRDIGVTPAALPDLADEAAAQWTAGFNPRSVSRDELLALYETAW